MFHVPGAIPSFTNDPDSPIQWFVILSLKEKDNYKCTLWIAVELNNLKHPEQNLNDCSFINLNSELKFMAYHHNTRRV